MMRFKASVVAACVVAPVLAGCGSGGNGGGEAADPAAGLRVDQALIDALTRERNEARAALEALRDSLGTAQEALDSPTAEGQRIEARRAVTAARGNLADVRRDLAQLEDGAAKTAADDALAAVDRALSLTIQALAAPATASGGVVSPANMHTTLDRAQTALDDAQAKLKTALEADPSAAMRGLLSQAQATLTTAQVSLVPLLRQELADAESEAATQLARAEAEAESERERAEAEKARAERERERADREKARADIYDQRVPLDEALVPRQSNFVPRGEAQYTRTPRTDTGEEGWRKLDIRTAAVPWAAGKKVGVDGGLGPTDELPLRSVTLRAAGRHPIKIQGDDGTPAAFGNTDGVLTSSLRLSEDGAEWKFGGEGIVYYDMQRTFDYFARVDAAAPDRDSWWRYGPDGKLGDAGAAANATITASHARDLGLDEATGTLTAEQATALQGYATDNAGACWRDPLSDCGDWAHDDIAVAFGAPSQSPQGEPSWYWKVQAPLTQTQRDTRLPKWMDPDHDDDDGRPEEIGTYELWISKYAGFLRGENTEDTSDDRHGYLNYAAYGLFMVFDNVKATPSLVRPQAFAFGYDAFRDADGMRTTDLTTSIAATFEGRTTARALINNGDPTWITLSGATPLRGDIELNACIGAGACAGDGIPATANTISGTISNLEELHHDGTWIPYDRGNSVNIPMAEGTIAADGSFGGRLDLPRNAAGDRINSAAFDADIRSTTPHHPSQYAGNLYGPRDGIMEAAGWWHMLHDVRSPETRSSIIGSFGAVCAEGCE